METKELTIEELKTTIKDTIKESELIKEMDDLKKSMDDIKSSKAVTKEEKAEKAAEFIRELVSDKLTAEKKTITTDTASFGYTCPVELEQAVHEKKDKIAKIRKNAFVFNLAGKYQLPLEGEGVTAYWITTEADSDLTQSNPTINKTDMDDYYLASRVRVPYKLLNTSAINIVDYISSLSARALVRQEESAFVDGDGSGKPTGIRQASIDSIAQSGADLGYDDLVDLFYSVPEQYRQNGKWLASTKAIKAIRKVKDADNMPVFDIKDQTIFGKELLEVTDIPENLGVGEDETEIYFGDLKEYWIKDGVSMLAEKRQVPGRLQVDLFLYQSVDGILVTTDAWRKMTGVKRTSS